MKTESSVWDQYRLYLAEATGKTEMMLHPALTVMKKAISLGCSSADLKIMMLKEFIPITIMQALEQWQNQMDLLIYTGIESLSGLSRSDYCDRHKNTNPFQLLVPSVLDSESDSPASDAHIYDLSFMTQKKLFAAYEACGQDAPFVIECVQNDNGLEHNWEIQMLLGDCYSNCRNYDKAIEIYESLWEQNNHKDNSIQDAIAATKFMTIAGNSLSEMSIDEWMGGYQEFRKQETIKRISPKISRNDPCPCGSGKKYKFCCGKGR